MGAMYCGVDYCNVCLCLLKLMLIDNSTYILYTLLITIRFTEQAYLYCIMEIIQFAYAFSASCLSTGFEKIVNTHTVLIFTQKHTQKHKQKHTQKHTYILVIINQTDTFSRILIHQPLAFKKGGYLQLYGIVVVDGLVLLLLLLLQVKG